MIVAYCRKSNIAAVMVDSVLYWHYEGEWRTQGIRSLGFASPWIVGIQNLSPIEAAYLNGVLYEASVVNMPGRMEFQFAKHAGSPRTSVARIHLKDAEPTLLTVQALIAAMPDVSIESGLDAL